MVLTSSMGSSSPIDPLEGLPYASFFALLLQALFSGALFGWVLFSGGFMEVVSKVVRAAEAHLTFLAQVLGLPLSVAIVQGSGLDTLTLGACISTSKAIILTSGPDISASWASISTSRMVLPCSVQVFPHRMIFTKSAFKTPFFQIPPMRSLHHWQVQVHRTGKHT